MTLPSVHGEFRAGADPELRFTPSGMAITSVRAVASSRKKQDDGSWVDDKTAWVKIICFKQMAENVAESIVKGDLFTVDGRLQVDEWEAKDGKKGITVEIVANSIGPSLSYATAKVSKTSRDGSTSGGSSAPKDDPWTTPPQDDEPPF